MVCFIPVNLYKFFMTFPIEFWPSFKVKTVSTYSISHIHAFKVHLMLCISTTLIQRKIYIKEIKDNIENQSLLSQSVTGTWSAIRNKKSFSFKNFSICSLFSAVSYVKNTISYVLLLNLVLELYCQSHSHTEYVIPQTSLFVVFLQRK